MLSRLTIFLLLNFGALGLGGLFTSKGVSSAWYETLNKAPWTPPGWVFGAVWTTIMICFSIYMAYLWSRVGNKKLLTGLYGLQWLLNVAWNPLFFYAHQVNLALAVIVLLTILIGYILIRFGPLTKEKSAFLAPYFLWLLIATSLNAYICFNI